MNIILRYPLQTVERQVIKLPKGAIVEYVQVQYVNESLLPTSKESSTEVAFMWCLGNIAEDKTERVFYLIGSCQEISYDVACDLGRRVPGIINMNNGVIVSHLYEAKGLEITEL